MPEIVDGYCHCGLSKYRPVEDVRIIMTEHGVSRAVLVQHLGEYDNSYIESVVAQDSDRFAGVFLIDVESPSAQEDLIYWNGRRVFRGIRLLAQTARTHPDIWEQAAECGLHIVVYAEPTIAPHSDAIGDFSSAHSETRLVISHLGVPNGQESPHFQSYQRILDLAKSPNVYIQISGFHMFCKPPYTELVPIVQRLVEGFGPKRSLYGSNFPVMGSDIVYRQELELLRAGRLGVPAASLDNVLGQTALSLWFGPKPSLENSERS